MATTNDPAMFASIASKTADAIRVDLSPSWVAAVRIVHEANPADWRRSLYADVRFELFGEDMSRSTYPRWSPDIDKRLRAALLVKEQFDRNSSTDRRLMRARAAHARNTKPKRA